GTVTGSRHLVEAGSTRVLVDCGLYQGVKALRLRNRAGVPVDPATLDAILITHAHIDHTGYLPVMVREGFRGPIYASSATADLCEILLPDAGHLQEEDAAYANRKGFSRHHPALPLYTEEDALGVLPLFEPLEPGGAVTVGELEASATPAGHILGAQSLLLAGDGGRALFSGDLGPDDDPIIPPPAPPPAADAIVMESTYGDRLHGDGDRVASVADVVRRTVERGGRVLIPSFAVGRAQLLLYCLEEAFRRGLAPRVPVFVNSPMATDVSELYVKHADAHRLSREACVEMFRHVEFVRSVEASKALVARRDPMVVVSASGMLTGGRVLHHLRAVAPDPDSTVLLVGYQAPGTRGAALLGGAERIKMFGEYVPVRCEVGSLGLFSAHADRDGLLAWLGRAPSPPGRTYLVHGEPVAADALRLAIEESLGWPARAAEDRESVEVPAAPVRREGGAAAAGK
ncbi:MAG TPA: MBL fold metallo-hydrolase, partial [Gemmatimonadota bacterium]|nr:MBL fold metallo-hydrolase [Gemmatimonadota bacterium]